MLASDSFFSSHQTDKLKEPLPLLKTQNQNPLLSFFSKIKQNVKNKSTKQPQYILDVDLSKNKPDNQLNVITEEGDTLTMKNSDPKAQFSFKIELYDKQIIDISIEKTQRIEEIKRKILKLNNILPMETMELYYEGINLNPEKRVEEYKLDDDFVLKQRKKYSSTQGTQEITQKTNIRSDLKDFLNSFFSNLKQQNKNESISDGGYYEVE